MKFIIKPTTFQSYSYIFTRENGETLLSSFNSYGSLDACLEAIRIFQKSAGNLKCFHFTSSGIGGYYYYLADEKGNPLAVSEMYYSNRIMRQSVRQANLLAKKTSIEVEAESRGLHIA